MAGLQDVIGWANWLMLAASVLALLWGVMLGVMLLRLRKLRWRRAQARPVPRDDIPAEIRAILDQAAPALERWGFRWRYSTRTLPSLVTPASRPVWSDVYEHMDGHSHALITPSETPESGAPYVVQWASGLLDGSNWISVNAYVHNVPAAPPRWQWLDDYLPTLDEAWQAHLRRVQAHGSAVLRDGIIMRQRLQQATEDLVPALVASGWLLPTVEPRRWRMSWRAAWQTLWQLQRGQRRAAKALAMGSGAPSAPLTAGATPEPGAHPDAAVQAQWHAWQQHRALNESLQSNRASKWRGFALSALLFLGVGAWMFSWRFVLILLVVIALHEGGHLLAMRLTGHRNLSVLFVPGLGGVAMGEKHDATPLQKLFVYLAGPLPGLALAVTGLLAWGMGAYMPPDWFTDFLIACLIVNYLNLLPITPLDGGRVMDTLVFSRLPALRFAFAATCCVALLAAGYWLGDWVLRVVGVLVALSLPHQWRVMRIDRRLAPHPAQALPEPQAVQAVFGAMQAAPFAQRWPFAQRLNVVKALLPELMARRARWRESLVGLVIYAACLVAPLGAALLALPHLAPLATALVGMASMPKDNVVEDLDTAPPPQVDWTARLAQPNLSADERLKTLLGAAEYERDMGEKSTAEQHLKAAQALAGQRPPGDTLRIDTWLAQAAHSDDEASSGAALQRVIDELPSPQGAQRLQLARAKEQLGYRNVPADQRLALLHEAVALRAAQGPPHDDDLLHTRALLADLLARAGDTTAAQTALEENLAALTLPPADAATRSALNRRIARANAQTQLAWFFIGQNKPAQAAALAREGIATVPPKPGMSWLMPQRDLHEALLWATLEAGEKARLPKVWKAYEAVDKASLITTPGNLLLEADRAVVAQALGDEAMAREAARQMQKITANGRVPGLCNPSGKAQGSSARLRQQRARAEALARAGVCAGKAG